MKPDAIAASLQSLPTVQQYFDANVAAQGMPFGDFEREHLVATNTLQAKRETPVMIACVAVVLGGIGAAVCHEPLARAACLAVAAGAGIVAYKAGQHMMKAVAAREHVTPQVAEMMEKLRRRRPAPRGSAIPGHPNGDM